ncbi:MAG: DUF3179 domain-containing (seleno)protein [Phycisphaerales bacterium]|jgi:hypothetical protein|nr:DUF3179 domain-containing (seleno)protein [Phycisphaerales bacterium]MDP6890145.1 DUF3179 domain-containing (seleno)protein [Phycisphaerales bacterium]
MNRIAQAVREGGWVLIVAVVMIGTLFTWAIAPAVLKMVSRPPGDGQTLSSYEFDLSNLRLPGTAVLETAMLHRDMIPVLDAPPGIVSAGDVVDIAATRNRYLVSDDAVIGVAIGDEARAYPLSILHVHEIIHDELGGIPIAITWHWPSASPRVFDRRLNGEPRLFGITGLVAGGNQTLYVRREDGEMGGEAIISQLLGRSITGPEMELETMPFRFTDWSAWMDEHPDTTVAAAVPALKKRYKHGDPATYYLNSDLLFETPVPDGGPAAKEPVLLLEHEQGDTLLLRAQHMDADPDLASLAPSAAATPPRIELASPPAHTDMRHALFHAIHSLGLDTENR